MSRAKKKNIAVILSGCGVFDGAEIHESVLTLLAIEKAGAQYQCLAPNIEQAQVINHLTGQEMQPPRNVLIESARIARGQVKDLASASADDFDAVILPGGYGAAKNLCDFAFKGADCQIQPDVLQFCQSMHQQAKPMGFICIAPAMIPKIIGQGSELTIGNDQATAQAITAMGGCHHNCPVDEFVLDNRNKIASTPAYMLAGSISEAASGIEKLVAQVIALIE